MNKKIITAVALAGILVGLGAAPAFADGGSIQVDLSQPGHPCYLLAGAPFGEEFDWTQFSTDFPLQTGNALDISVTPVNNRHSAAVCQGAQAGYAPAYSIPFSVSYKGVNTLYTLVHADSAENTGSMADYLKAADAKPAEYAALGLPKPEPTTSTSTQSPSVAPLAVHDPAAGNHETAQNSSPTAPILVAIIVVVAMIAAVWVAGIRRRAKERGAQTDADLS